MAFTENTSHAPGSTRTAVTHSEKELYFLIANFLSNGPCKKAGKAIVEELEKRELIPQRIDWKGNTHSQTYNEFSLKYSSLPRQFLHDLVTRVSPLLQQVAPQIPNRQHSLLSTALLRKWKDGVKPPASVSQAVLKDHSRIQSNTFTNSVLATLSRDFSNCPTRQKNFLTNKLYSRLQLFARNAGHLWAVYCLLYDRHGKYIITGADDMLVKIWSVTDGRLIATLRGASAEITDLAVDYNNTMVAAGSVDKTIRVWSLQTCAPIAVLSGHGGMIICLLFSPSPGDEGTLVSTGGDGCVAFWSYSKKDFKIHFDPKPLKYNERIRPGNAQLICSSFSSGGNFLVIGGADHVIRVYQFKDEVDKILEMELHQERVETIQWCHLGVAFISGSKDGTAIIWRYKRQQWKTTVLNMTEVLTGVCVPQEDLKKLNVTMVGWDLTDKLVITASSDKLVRVWDSTSGRLMHCLKGHEDNAYVIEAHPTNSRLILTAGHDGQLYIWDIICGCSVKSFKNVIEGQGYGSLFDAKWAPDGLSIVSTDSHGHILIFGIGQNDVFKKIPSELFFHTDYRPLMRDLNNHVLDEQTQLAPHLMPPPFLVNMDGNPYPPAIQRLVPGRQFCRDDQLVPNVILNDNGEREVMDPEEVGVPVEEAVPQRDNEERDVEAPNIDQMIRRFVDEQDLRMGGGVRPHNPAHSYAAESNRAAVSPRAGRVGARRDGDIEGVRQSTGNWQRGSNINFKTNSFVAPLTESECVESQSWRQAQSTFELREYDTEMRKAPEACPVFKSPCRSQPETARVRKKPKIHSYPTRSIRVDSQNGADLEDRQISSYDYNSEGSGAAELDDHFDTSESSDSGSSTEYSDWTADAGVDLQPPKRTAHKQKRSLVEVRKSRRRRAEEPSLSENDRPDSDSSQPSTATRRRRKVPRVHMVEAGLEEIPDEYKPPEWLCETVPKKAPYFPQMGDELIYFQQGHQLYVEAVLNRKLYLTDSQSLPWHRRKNLREQEYVKIIGMKYEIKPPRLCCLKFGILDGEGTLTGDSFTIKYHDMADVLDFLVLKPAYDIAVGREWKTGDRFRCIIDDAWWFGEVERHEPHVAHFADSMFLCYKVIWDNGERERLSPWDMEPIDEQAGIPERGGSVRVRPKEYKRLLYRNWSENWNGRPFKSECKRISQTLGKVMELSAAEPFLAPVDLSAYPNYALLIEYPMDLSTIKSRLENYFYRSPNSVQFDMRYIATNAEKFNKKGSTIVKNARIITDLCLTIIQDPNFLDPTAFYHQAMANYHSPNHSENEASTGGPSRRTRRSGHRDLDSNDEELVAVSSASPRRDNRPWKQQCSDLMAIMMEREDSIPFRHAVNLREYPDYNQVIDDPMCLVFVKEELENDLYPSPVEFYKDIRLIFYNSKSFNTNKRSRIYSMTLRLEAFFEDKIKEILVRFRAQENSRQAGPSNGYNGLASTRYFDTSEEEEDRTQPDERPASSTKRRSRRVANLRRQRGDSGRDSDHGTSRLRYSGRKKITQRRSSRRYEDDSDFEQPAPTRRNSTSSSGRSKKSRRYESDSDYDRLPTSHEEHAPRVNEPPHQQQQPVQSVMGRATVNGDGPAHSGGDSPSSESQSAEEQGSADGTRNVNGHVSSPATSRESAIESEFECDDEDLEESDYSDEAEKKPKRKPVVNVRRPKATIRSDDGTDQDFVVDEDEIDDEASSSSSSESSSSGDSVPQKKKKKKSEIQRKKPEKRKRPRKGRKRANGTIKVNSKREIRQKGELIGRIVRRRSPTYSSESSDSSIPIPKYKRPLAESEVGTRGRVRKRVRYNEDDSDESETANVSSRGRVRRTNTRMKDFI